MDRRGGILLLTVLLLGLLSVLFLLATNSALLQTKARQSLRGSLEMFYIAEAGLSHGQAFCAANGEAHFLPAGEGAVEVPSAEGEVEAPFGLWFPFGRGQYRVEAYRMGVDEQPFVQRESGILLVATARLAGRGEERVCLLLDDPPNCRALAWWEPQ